MVFPDIQISKIVGKWLSFTKQLPATCFQLLRRIKVNTDVKKYAFNTGILALSIFISGMLISHIPELSRMIVSAKGKNQLFASTETDSVKLIRSSMEKSMIKLQKKTSTYSPTSPYLIVNTSLNEFSLYKNRKLVMEGKCSTGSYIQLQGSNRNWIFKTPRGEFRIHGKTTSPVWKKPDWAFVEEGMAVPSANDPSRFEYGVLGDYAMSIGQGYLIHGTLYKRYLGAAVTHGCIRLNDEDLEKTYQTMSVGSKVYIY